MISLLDVLNGNKIEEIKEEWKLKGYCLVSLSTSTPTGEEDESNNYIKNKEMVNKLKNNTAQASKYLLEWFSSPQPFQRRNFRSPVSPILGHITTNHKSSLRFLTKEHNHKLKEKIWKRNDTSNKPDIAKKLEDLSIIFELNETADEIMEVLLTNISLSIFGFEKVTELREKFQIPSFGMMDYAYYYNRSEELDNRSEYLKTSAMNCVEHFDPGLFTLSFYSSQDGLQLYDPSTETWNDIPSSLTDSEIAVLWTGQAAVDASNGTIQPGRHRVKFIAGEPRLSIWYEICTNNQIFDEKKIKRLENYLYRTGEPLFIPSFGPSGMNITIPKSSKSNKNRIQNKRNNNNNKKCSNTKVDVKNSVIFTSIEKDLGISMSKSSISPKVSSVLPTHLESWGLSLGDAKINVGDGENENKGMKRILQFDSGKTVNTKKQKLDQNYDYDNVDDDDYDSGSDQ